MKVAVIKLAVNNVKSRLAEQLYLKTGIDFSRPVQISGLLNKRCNAKCRMCEERKNLEMPELPAAVWNRSIASLKSFVGVYHINFSGGEPFVKDDLFEILEFCHQQGISFGLTTNGMLLNEKNVKRLLGVNPTNINISVDSMRDEIHDFIRGVPGVLERIREGVALLCKHRKEMGVNPGIMLKAIVCKETLPYLHEIVEYAEEMQLTGVNFQPLMLGADDAEEMFKVDKNELDAVIEKLCAMKQAGGRILNSVPAIQDWRTHFDSVTPMRNAPCVVGLRTLTIAPDGEVNLCPFCNSRIGNIEHDDIKAMWYSPDARRIRRNLVNCKKLCTAACTVQRTWKDYAELFLRLVRSS